MRKKDTSAKIAGVLPSVTKDKGWEKQLDLHSIFPKWRELVSQDAGEHAEPLKIERNILWLEVENSSWLQQLQYQKMELLETLNDFLRLTRLQDIKMVLPKSGEPIRRKKELPPVTFKRVDEKRIAAFKSQVEIIEDEKCRDALMQFWYLSQACQRDEK